MTSVSTVTTALQSANGGKDFHEDEPLVGDNMSFHDITELVSYHTEKKTPRSWLLSFAIASTVLSMLLVMNREYIVA